MQESDVPLYLHAEFLPNIRQITLYVSLPRTAAFAEVRPEIQLSESRKAVTVSLPKPFEHVTETMKLPARVSDASRRALKPSSGLAPKSDSQGPGDSSHDYSFRMQIDPDDEALAPRDELIDEFVPWTAGEMVPTTRIRCRKCENPFLDLSLMSESGDAKTSLLGWVWKDLPSGNWAEMMDFWHCHKPDPHEGHEKEEKDSALQLEEQTAQTRGYGAESHVVAISGTVLVDVATFLLAEKDCTGLIKVCLILCIFSSFSFYSSISFSSHCFRTGQLRRGPPSSRWGGLRYYCPRWTKCTLCTCNSGREWNFHRKRDHGFGGQLSSLCRWISLFASAILDLCEASFVLFCDSKCPLFFQRRLF
jgi:hypothetical protein